MSDDSTMKEQEPEPLPEQNIEEPKDDIQPEAEIEPETVETPVEVKSEGPVADAAAIEPKDQSATEAQPHEIEADPTPVDVPASTKNQMFLNKKVEMLTDGEAERRIRKISRRSFMLGGAAAIAAVAGWRWIVTRPENNGLSWPLRRILRGNETIARALYSENALAPTFPKSWARDLIVTGDDGLGDDFDPTQWSLEVDGGKKIHDKLDDQGNVQLDLHDIKSLPRYDIVTEHHCVEGWSKIVHWTGARFSDFAEKFGPAVMTDYVSLMTPDGGYYVGIEKAAALHPQTLLAYAINDQPLGPDHGEPLRLAIPTKYGIKNIKRIGSIEFTNTRPDDFWYDQGYDWYAGL